MSSDPSRWTIRLSDSDIAEILAAVQAFLARGGDIASMRASDLPLPGLGPRLTALRQELLHGRGFALVRALPVDRMRRAEAAAAFCGLGAHLGQARSQNAMGHILGHVTDLGRDPGDPTARIYQTHARQSFHTDGCDVVALLCLAEARQGGDSLLVSGEAIFNEMLRRRPDLLRLLLEPVATDRRGEVPDGAKPWFEIPVFALHKGRVSMQYQRQYIDSAQRFPAAPRLTPAHVEALDLFDALCNDPAFHFTMRLAPGDMQFVYNHALLHDRTGFVDHPEPERRRHLLRLWLAMAGDRALPPSFAQKYGSIRIGDRGGITVAGTRLNAPLEPV